MIDRRSTFKRALALAACVASCVAALSAALPAMAQTAASKVAIELQLVINATAAPNNLSWATEMNNIRYVKVLMVSTAADPDLVALRADVLAKGGAVIRRFISVRALLAVLPANQVATLAARTDVQSIAPDRMTSQTASTLEASVGALTPAVRSYTTSTAYTGLDGSGIGIAVLDSGIMRTHKHFLNNAGTTSRYQRGIDLQTYNTLTASGDKLWVTGVDLSQGMVPGSAALASYESAIAVKTTSTVIDLYGHGTHVAAIAAGNGRGNTVDSTGVAPNANLYDIRVLNEIGQGTLSDLLGGIDWVIYHAREYNIRVMNLSVASASTQSWQIDPLCIAVRSATAAGITVVVAAGNFGKNSVGTETYGTVSSPGNEPSVITVGSVNTKGTALRSDDSVNLFSSRGPTRGSYIDASGVRQIDNLLKPDLVAPGNKLLGAMATSTAGARSYLPSQYSDLFSFTGYTATLGKTQMMLSGTSVAAPAVAGTVALMLQANPGLTQYCSFRLN